MAKAEYRKNDKEDWKPAKVKDVLMNGYQLQTTTGNKAVILYNATGSRVLVNENTQIEVQGAGNCRRRETHKRPDQDHDGGNLFPCGQEPQL